MSQTTELISERKTGLKHNGQPVYEVTRKYCKDGWRHKVSTITDLCVKNSNGSYTKIYTR